VTCKTVCKSPFTIVSMTIDKKNILKLFIESVVNRPETKFANERPTVIDMVRLSHLKANFQKMALSSLQDYVFLAYNRNFFLPLDPFCLRLDLQSNLAENLFQICNDN
jgi:hypothetical protein